MPENEDSIALKRCRVVMEYPRLNSRTNLRWDQNTPLVVGSSLESRCVPIKRLWTATAYFPFPEAGEPSVFKLPRTPVISEEQNGTLELYDGIPSLHLTMWNRNANRNADFHNYAYNLCLGIDPKTKYEDAWRICQQTLPTLQHDFCPHPNHPLHRSTRTHFFDEDLFEQPNNLPMLVIWGKHHTPEFKERDELITLFITQAFAKRMPLVSRGLKLALEECITLFPTEAWKNNLEETLATLLWGGKFDNLINNLITEFKAWCKCNGEIYPVWALCPEYVKTVSKFSFYAVVLSAVSVYQHSYGLKHLSPGPLVEELRLLQCISDKKEFVWGRGHTRCSLRTSQKLKRYLDIEDETMEVRTVKAFTGERLNIPT